MTKPLHATPVLEGQPAHERGAGSKPRRKEQDMGLGTTHDAWSGGYQAFNQWKEALAVMDGADPHPARHISQEHSMGRWADGELPDFLMVLTCHSDCDGIIPSELAGPLADRVEEIINREGPFTLQMPQGWTLKEFRRVTKRFVKGLRLAADLDEDLEFH